MSDRPSVFVTGASGYIAKHIILTLLRRGYDVTGSVRSLTRAAEVRAAIEPHCTEGGDIDARLRFSVLDLTSDRWWATALEGSDMLIHSASPFPFHQPRDDTDLIRPAVDGTLRALTSAKDAGINRIVMTSSVGAILSSHHPEGRPAFSESDWTDLKQPGVSAYAKSKTLAEQAAWQFAQTHPQIALSTINPALVVGPPLDLNYGASIALIERLLQARDAMLPQFGIPLVDVRDVAEMHVRALERPDTIGKRFIAADRFLWYHEMATTLKDAHPDLGISTRPAPIALTRIMAQFTPWLRPITPLLGKRLELSSTRARAEMGMRFRPAADSLRDTAAYLIANKTI